MLDLPLLRSFVAVAELEHVGRAAQALGISQSPLSRQIRKLEGALGLDLFHRERQRIRLTVDGRWFLVEARRILGQVTDLERQAERLARGESGAVRIGFVKTAMWSEVLPRALGRFKDARPDVAIELRAATSADQRAGLHAGELDVGLVHAGAHDGLESAALLSEPLVLALPKASPLAKRRAIEARDLAGVDFVALSPGAAGRSAAELSLSFARAGFLPTVRYVAGDLTTVLALVDAGMGASLVPRSAAAEGRRGLVLRALPWLRHGPTLHVVWRRPSPVVRELVTCVRDAAAGRRT